MYHKIMVPLDGSELAECVLPHVESIANGCGVTNVSLVRAVEPLYSVGSGDYSISPDELRKMEEQGRVTAEQYLAKVVKRLTVGKTMVNTTVLTGMAAESLADYARDNDMDLIVIATHGRSGVSRWVWGSVADRLLRSSCVPVLIVRAPGCVPGF